MPKATIEWDLNDTDEKADFDRMTRAGEYSAAIDSMLEYLRTQHKYNENLNGDQLKVYETIRKEFYEILGNSGITDFD